MKNKTIAIIGIGSYILSVVMSAEDLEGNFVYPIVLIVISQIVKIIFTILATVRLWKKARYVSIILASSAIILFVLSVIQGITLPKYGSPIIISLNVSKIIYFLAFFYAIILLWTMAKYEEKLNKIIKDIGLTPERVSLLHEDLQKGDQESGVQRITKRRNNSGWKKGSGDF